MSLPITHAEQIPMALDDTTLLAMAVSAAAVSWPPATTGNPNQVDILVLAKRLQSALSVTLPNQLTSPHDGVRLVEFVEQQVVAGTLIRGQVPAVLGKRVARLAELITANQLELGSMQATVVAALYLWHGCTVTASLLQDTFAAKQGNRPYSPEQRVEGYAALRQTWTQEESRGNPWIRYGVGLARIMEQEHQGQDFARTIHEDWIPKDSPYWQ